MSYNREEHCQPIQTTFAWLQPGDVIHHDDLQRTIAACTPYSPTSVQLDWLQDARAASNPQRGFAAWIRRGWSA